MPLGSIRKQPTWYSACTSPSSVGSIWRHQRSPSLVGARSTNLAHIWARSDRMSMQVGSGRAPGIRTENVYKCGHEVPSEVGSSSNTLRLRTFNPVAAACRFTFVIMSVDNSMCSCISECSQEDSYCPSLGIGRQYLKEVYAHFRKGRVENYFGKKNLRTPNRDSNTDLSDNGILVYCEISTLDHATPEAGRAFEGSSKKPHSTDLNICDIDSFIPKALFTWPSKVDVGEVEVNATPAGGSLAVASLEVDRGAGLAVSLDTCIFLTGVQFVVLTQDADSLSQQKTEEQHWQFVVLTQDADSLSQQKTEEQHWQMLTVLSQLQTEEQHWEIIEPSHVLHACVRLHRESPESGNEHLDTHNRVSSAGYLSTEHGGSYYTPARFDWLSSLFEFSQVRVYNRIWSPAGTPPLSAGYKQHLANQKRARGVRLSNHRSIRPGGAGRVGVNPGESVKRRNRILSDTRANITTSRLLFLTRQRNI
uniref:Uncharacterized protein n=1 Tax=Timema monikensis TaxID=170555 RepID=A0A7R9EEB0_9NEOP|nr:unnamed protein product [Timema monikensis]